MVNMYFYVLSRPEEKTGVIVASVANVAPVMDMIGKYKQIAGQVIEGGKYPDIYNILWYLSRYYSGYSWRIVTE